MISLISVDFPSVLQYTSTLRSFECDHLYSLSNYTVEPVCKGCRLHRCYAAGMTASRVMELTNRRNFMRSIQRQKLTLQPSTALDTVFRQMKLDLEFVYQIRGFCDFYFNLDVDNNTKLGDPANAFATEIGSR